MIGRRCCVRATLGRTACCAWWAAAWQLPPRMRPCPAYSGRQGSPSRAPSCCMRCRSQTCSSIALHAAKHGQPANHLPWLHGCPKNARQLRLHAWSSLQCLVIEILAALLLEDTSAVRLIWHMQAPYEDLPFLFFGEEQHMLRRMWTAGYDMFAPPASIAFHMWSRAKRCSFQECVQQVGALAELPMELHWDPFALCCDSAVPCSMLL